MNKLEAQKVTQAKAKHLQVVPPSGLGFWLTGLTAAVMSFLAIFALALALTAGAVAQKWVAELQGKATIRLVQTVEDGPQKVQAILGILAQTPGILVAAPLGESAQAALLAPWLGDGIPLDTLPLPQMIDMTYAGETYDFEGLRLRLAAEVPDAIIDDHMRFQAPVMAAVRQLRLIGYGALSLILATTAMMVVLAVNAALAANESVIKVLQLVGATDRYIVRAFVRRFTVRAFAGATMGSLCAVFFLFYMPIFESSSGFVRAFG
ncbi:MAG: cell division transport system permease protein, partial [Paracoccaceae bacterium]